jgi:hypothetical protein
MSAEAWLCMARRVSLAFAPSSAHASAADELSRALNSTSMLAAVALVLALLGSARASSGPVRAYAAAAALADEAEAGLDYVAALRLREEASAAAARIPETDEEVLEIRAIALNNLAAAKFKQGPATLEPLFRAAAAAFLAFETLGNKGAASAHNGLAMALEDLGRTEVAIALYADIEAALRDSYGANASETLRAMHNHASALMELELSLEEGAPPLPEPRPLRRAVALLREALAGRERLGDDAGTGVDATLLNLGMALSSLGEMREAKALLVRCAAESERLAAGAGRTPPQLRLCAQRLKELQEGRERIERGRKRVEL